MATTGHRAVTAVPDTHPRVIPPVAVNDRRAASECDSETDDGASPTVGCEDVLDPRGKEHDDRFPEWWCRCLRRILNVLDRTANGTCAAGETHALCVFASLWRAARLFCFRRIVRGHVPSWSSRFVSFSQCQRVASRRCSRA